MYAIILDTEGYSNKNAYNIGYVIADMDKYEIVEKVNLSLLWNVWDNLEEKLRRENNTPQNAYLSEMALRNFKDILTDSGKKYRDIRTENGLFKHFIRIFRKYEIKDLYAFNYVFDKSILKKTFSEYHYNLLFKEMNYHDIQTIVFYTFCCNLEYVKFCVVNGYLTEKGNCKTKAETFYRFLTGNRNFEEEHTALADAEIEADMLFKALKINPNVCTKHIKPYHLLNELYDKDNPDEIASFFDDIF